MHQMSTGLMLFVHNFKRLYYVDNVKSTKIETGEIRLGFHVDTVIVKSPYLIIVYCNY